ncbi:hypothetical protein PybrP1_009222 [[Pythium] brassicae (nom. inval.)]|nr:hypothetical protein PybrP1_009222 [[Pythium] brassicae (nom. inval.)]
MPSWSKTHESTPVQTDPLLEAVHTPGPTPPACTPPPPTHTDATDRTPSPTDEGADGQDLAIRSSTAAASTPNTVERTSHRTVFFFDDHRRTKVTETMHKISYRCSGFRRTGCRGKLSFTTENMTFAISTPHTFSAQSALPTAATRVEDVTVEMMEATDSLAVADLRLAALAVWSRISEQLYSNGGVARRGLTREQTVRRVYRARQHHFGRGSMSLVEDGVLAMVTGTNLPFFQFRLSYPVRSLQPAQSLKVERLLG